MASHSACPYCGAALSPEARYCDRCGTPLKLPSGETPSRRRGRAPRRVAGWAFGLILFVAFAVGTLGGFGYKSGSWVRVLPSSLAAAHGPGPVDPVTAPLLSDDPAVAGYLRSVVSINVEGSQGNRSGSGFVMDAAGHVVTAAHVVDGATGCVTVFDDNGRAHQGRVANYDRNLDVALVDVPTLADWPVHLDLGVSGDVREGDEVYVLGSPRGAGKPVTLSAKVSNIHDQQRVEGQYFPNLIRLSGAEVVEGGSGGPLVARSTGSAVGIVTIGGVDNAAWAIPIDSVAQLIRNWSAKAVHGNCDTLASSRTVPVILAAIAPLSGSYGAEGTDIVDGVTLALRDMDSDLRVAGYAVTLKSYDDKGVPSTGGELAGEAAYDPSVIGVVGSLDSPVTQAIAEALVPPGLVVVTPTAGAEDLAIHGWPNFDRLVANSRRQEQAAARFARDRLGVRSVFLLDDGSNSALTQAAAFESAARAVGLVIADRVMVSPTTGHAELEQRLADARAEAIYVAGRSETALPVVTALRDDGVTLPILGSDALADPHFQRVSGGKAQGIYFTRLTAQTGAQFQRHFESDLGKPTRGYAAYGYDAAGVILSALARYGQAHPGQIPPRTELAQLVRETRGYAGWSTWVTFDKAGENTTAWVYLFEWMQGKPELIDNLKW